ncbi:hypothetical protein B0H13DRAFT_2282513 [Mycena leptocephala]|nr:hypothetical protein B0H13DRAFT_2282513 [Mycena leptocephala]
MMMKISAFFGLDAGGDKAVSSFSLTARLHLHPYTRRGGHHGYPLATHHVLMRALRLSDISIVVTLAIYIYVPPLGLAVRTDRGLHWMEYTAVDPIGWIEWRVRAIKYDANESPALALSLQPIMSTLGERPYIETDLAGNKKSLVKLVQRQLSKGPGPGKFQPSKVTVAQLKLALLDPHYGFTTNQPPVTSVHAPKSISHGSGPTGGLQTTSNAPANPTALRPSTPPASKNPGPVELVTTRIYVGDCRFSPSQKTVAMVSLPVLDRENCAPGFIRVLGKDIISALQESHAAIEIPATGSGTVKVSFPDPDDEEWKIPFVRLPCGQVSEFLDFNPEALEIMEGGRRLKLFIEYVEPSFSAIKNEAETSSINPHPGPLELTQLVGPGEPENPAIQFLREKLATRYRGTTGHQRHLIHHTAVLSCSHHLSQTTTSMRIELATKYYPYDVPVAIWLMCWSLCSCSLRQLRRISLLFREQSFDIMALAQGLDHGNWREGVHRLHRTAVRLDRLAEDPSPLWVRTLKVFFGPRIPLHYSHLSIDKIHLFDTLQGIRMDLVFPMTLGRYRNLSTLHIGHTAIDPPFREALQSLPKLKDLLFRDCLIHVGETMPLNILTITLCSSMRLPVQLADLETLHPRI